MLAIVAVVDLTREATLRAQSRNHGRAFQDRVGRSTEVLLKRDVDGDGLDGMDAHGALAWFASGKCPVHGRTSHRCGRMPIVGYTIDDLSFGIPTGDFVDDGSWHRRRVTNLSRP